jgi:hypothetical protein
MGCEDCVVGVKKMALELAAHNGDSAHLLLGIEATSHRNSSLLCCILSAGITWGKSASARLDVSWTLPE